MLGKLFSHDKEETPAPAQPVLEIPTGEILLGADAKPVQPEQEDMALELRTADPVPAMPMQPASPEPAKAVPAEPVPAPKAAAAVQPEPEKPAPQPVPQPVAAPQKQPKAKNAPETLLPQEELEQREGALSLYQKLHALPEPYREVFWLRVYGELTFAEIAALHHKTESWARVTFLGISTSTITYWSPRPRPFRYWMPWPRRRNFVPLWVPSGTVYSTLPSMEGTVTLCPAQPDCK